MVWMPTNKDDLPVALSVAGSDSIAGAGIQADIKTFIAHGVYPVTVVTVITAQNTVGVQKIYPLPPNIVESQIDSVFSDIKVKALKIGVMYTTEIAKAIYSKIKELEIPKVLDPIIRSQTGQMLIENYETLDFIKNKLLPAIDIITPNKEEAEILSGIKITNIKDAEEAAKKIASMGPKTVVIKGLSDDNKKSIDIVYHEGKISKLEMEKIKSIIVHGAGCTFSSAITANLARGLSTLESIKLAKEFVWKAIKHSIEVGKGLKIVNQMVRIYKESEKEEVRRELWKSYLELRKIESIADYIPETRTNFVYSLPEPDNINEVAGFPGRLTVIDDELIAYYKPEFGVSSHMARAVLEANELNKKIRSAINLKFEENIVKKAKSIGFNVVGIDRDQEPQEVRDVEGESIKWIIREAYKRAGEIPDIVYDTGTMGKEPMIRVLGQNPNEIVSKIRKILTNKSAKKATE